MSILVGEENRKFYTANTGICVHLGKSKHQPSSLNSSVSMGRNMLYHSSVTPDYGSDEKSITRFMHKRREGNISNIFVETQNQYKMLRELKGQSLSSARKEKLRVSSDSHGYNLITGEVNNMGLIQTERRRRTHLGYGKCDETTNRAEIVLRDSDSRFFRPPPTGKSNDYRLNNLVTHGMTKEPKTSTLPGKYNLRSFGIEDQFSRNMYESRPDGAIRGLVESFSSGLDNRNAVGWNASSGVSIT